MSTRPKKDERLETRKLELEVAKLELELERLENSVLTERASIADEAPFVFNGVIAPDSVAKFINTLDIFSRKSPGSTIRIVIHSPGGLILPGLAMCDFIEELQERGHHVVVKGIGLVASMAAVVLQMGNERVLSPRAYLMVHEVSNEHSGNVTQLKNDMAFTERLNDNLLDILASKSSMTKKAIAKKWSNNDWWMDAEEALAAGFIDRIDN